MRTIIICTKELSEYKEWSESGCFDKKSTNYARFIEVKKGGAQIVFLYCPLVKNCAYTHVPSGNVGLLYHHIEAQIPIFLGQIGVPNPVFQARCGTHQTENREQYENLQAALGTDQLPMVFDTVWDFFFDALKNEKLAFLKSIDDGIVHTDLPSAICTAVLSDIFDPLRNVAFDRNDEAQLSAFRRLRDALLKG